MLKRQGWKIMLGISNTTITEVIGLKTSDLEVFVPELTPNASGKPDDSPISDNVVVTNPLTGEKSGATVPKIQTIICQYMGGQNFTVPCVHKGEQVWVLQYEGGELSYYWLPMGREADVGIRQHEHIRWFAMNRKKSILDDGTIDETNDDNTYFVDINTNPGKKLIQVHTSKNDGETYGYDIRIKPEEHWLEIIDTAGNYLHLDSFNTIWKWYNINNSYIELNKTDINIHCLNNLTITVGNNMITSVGVNKITTIGKDKSLTIGGNNTTTVTGNISETAVANIVRTATGNITDNSAVYNNLCQAMVETAQTSMTITGLNVDIIGLAKVGFTGPLMQILNAHGTINGLGGW